MRHKMTFSHFSKDLIRPNLGEESKRNQYSAFSVARSERLIQRQRGLLWNSASSALSA